MNEWMNGQVNEQLQLAQKTRDSGRILLRYETEVTSNRNGLNVCRQVPPGWEKEHITEIQESYKGNPNGFCTLVFWRFASSQDHCLLWTCLTCLTHRPLPSAQDLFLPAGEESRTGAKTWRQLCFQQPNSFRVTVPYKKKLVSGRVISVSWNAIRQPLAHFPRDKWRTHNISKSKFCVCF